jgi:AcrR family transcriptional regulator
MIKAFTKINKKLIKRNLIKKGREYFIRYGVKKTSIDELARAAGISKGSFYKFFNSKEALFLAIHEESEDKLRKDMMKKLAGIEKPIDKLRTFFKSAFDIMEEDPMLRIIFNQGEFENLNIFLSSNQYENHYHYDIAFLEELLKQWQAGGIVRKLDTRTASNMIANVCRLILQKEIMDKEMYKKVKNMLIECLSNYLAEPE